MDIKNGLTNKEVKKNREKYGTNEITSEKRNTFLKLFIETLGDPIIKILLIALAVKTVFLFQNFDWFETLGIMIAILLASFISTISEYGSEKAFSKLQEDSSKIKCKVIRDGNISEIIIEDLVVGDLVLLSSGDIVPADATILSGELSLDESSFTGETKDIHKSIDNEIYRGSTVLNGTCYAKITKVGLNTKYGKIALELLSKNPDSPLKLRLKGLAIVISKIGYTGAILVFISYLFSVIFISNNFDINLILKVLTTPKVIFGHILYALTLAVTIIIVSVPEGLPMMVALVLSSNMKRMIKSNVLVRRMVGIETAGSLTTLFTDKTGTITKGNLEVSGIILGNKVINSIDEVPKSSVLSKYLLECLIALNEAKLNDKGEIIGGNITDKALLEFAKKYKTNYKVLDFTEFSSKTKFSSAVLDDGNEHELYKGAPEVLLSKVTDVYDMHGNKTRADKVKIQNSIDNYTKKGYRVIILANKERKHSSFLTLVGIVILKDEINENAKEAVKTITEAGVNIVMITGDAKETAINIGVETGILKKESDMVITSSELHLMSERELKSILPYVKVVARALPEDKSKLVKLSQELGEVVGMTGDGVNDASALKCADVGFSMGTGSEIAKEASDIVILDNNLKSIGTSILYGRTIFKSIRKFIVFQLTMNMCALSLSILGPFLSINTPVTVMQMLWINMIMDTLAGLAFSFEPALMEYMKEKPIEKKEPILNGYMYSNILVTGIYTTILLILFLKSNVINSLFRYDISDKYLMTAFFGLFVFSGVLNAFNARTSRINILANITKNKPFIIIISLIVLVQIFLLYNGGNSFRTYGLSLNEFLIVVCLSLTVLPVDMARKRLLKYIKK